MLRDIIHQIAYKKYGTILASLKLNWNIIDNSRRTYPKSYNSYTKILIIKCMDSENKLENRYLIDKIKTQVEMNFGLEVNKIKFI